MNELINFLVKSSKWFLFLVYVVISCILLFQGNPYQHHVYLTSANSVCSTVYGVSNSITSYFNLRDINDDLNRRNAALEHEVLTLRRQLEAANERIMADTLTPLEGLDNYEFTIARVINNSVARPNNYLTINKGSSEGITPELGVIDQNGVVGIVNVVGEHNSRVISLLNPNLRLSCKIKGNESFGSLVWDGNDPHIVLLEELPRHTRYKRGDTVVTSGYSAVFPPGIPVGIIESDNGRNNENFFTLRVRLLSDLTTLSNVQVVRNTAKPELDALNATDADEKSNDI